MPPTKTKKETVARNRRRRVVGIVASDKMDKTITVRVERLVQHPQFGKMMRKNYLCYAHDEKEEAGVGDTVELMETRPLSKLKSWRLQRVVAKAAAAPAQDAQEAARPDSTRPEAPSGPPA
jgi:small subunit ribosomal protein S17